MAYSLEIADFDLQVFSEVNPDLTGLSHEEKRAPNSYTTRVYPDGEALFFGDDYDLLFSYESDKVAYNLYENGEMLSTGFFLRTGEIDITNKKFPAELILDDVLTDFVEKGKEKYNILEAVDNGYDILIKNDFYELYEETFEVLIKTPTGIQGILTYDGAAETTKITEINTNGLEPADPLKTLISVDYNIFPTYVYEVPPNVTGAGYYFIGTATTKKISLVSYGTIINGVNTPPDLSGWVFDSMVSFGNFELPKYLKAVDIGTAWTNTVTTSATGDEGTKSLKYINNKSDFAFTEYLTYTRSRTFENITKFLVDKINPTLTFDANSFNYFDTHTGVSLTYEDVSSSIPFKDLSIGQITDFIPLEDLTQKTIASTIGMLSFDEFMLMLRTYFNAKYKVSGGVFSFVQYTEFATSGNNPDYESLNGVNYLSRGNQIEKNEAEYDNIVNGLSGNSVDFFGGEMRFPTLNLHKDITISSNKFYTDIADIFRAKGDSYNVNATDQFVLMALQEVNSKYYLRNPQGLVSGQTASNGELSFVDLATNVLADLPDENAEINGVVSTLDSARLSKLNTATFQFPFQKFSEVDFLKIVDFFGNDAEFTSVKKEMGQNIADCEIKFAEILGFPDGRIYADGRYRIYGTGSNDVRVYK